MNLSIGARLKYDTHKSQVVSMQNSLPNYTVSANAANMFKNILDSYLSIAISIHLHMYLLINSSTNEKTTTTQCDQCVISVDSGPLFLKSVNV